MGYISDGGDIEVATMTIAEAKARCSVLGPRCQGFTFLGPPTTSPVQIWFKDHWDICGSAWTSFRYSPGERTRREGTEPMQSMSGDHFSSDSLERSWEGVSSK